MMRKVVALALSSLFVSACYFTTTFSGLSGGASDDAGGVHADGAASSSSSGSSSGGGDSGVSEGGPSGDGSSPPGDFCQGAAFCDQFERDLSDTKGSWDSAHAGTQSSIGLSTARAHSGSTSLHIELSKSADAAGVLTKQLSNASHVKETFWMIVDKIPTRAINLGGMELNYGNRQNTIYFILEADGLVAAELEFVGSSQTFFKAHATAPVIVTGRFTEVTLDIDLNTGQAVWSYDGKPLIAEALVRQYSPTPITVLVGSPYSTVGDPYPIDFDDVRVDITP